MNVPVLRSLVPGATPETGPLAEPGEIAPVPALLAMETLTSYLRTVDPRREGRRTWEDYVIDHEITDSALLLRCERALEDGRARLIRPKWDNSAGRGGETRNQATVGKPSRVRTSKTGTTEVPSAAVPSEGQPSPHLPTAGSVSSPQQTATKVHRASKSTKSFTPSRPDDGPSHQMVLRV